MPLIQVKSSVKTDTDQVNKLLQQLSSRLAKHLGKSEAYVMTAFEGGLSMSFGGSFEPACFVAIKSIGNMTPTQTKSISQDVCQILNDSLGLQTNRIYIEFVDIKGYMWGWNSSTFG